MYTVSLEVDGKEAMHVKVSVCHECFNPRKFSIVVLEGGSDYYAHIFLSDTLTKQLRENSVRETLFSTKGDKYLDGCEPPSKE